MDDAVGTDADADAAAAPPVDDLHSRPLSLQNRPDSCQFVIFIRPERPSKDLHGGVLVITHAVFLFRHTSQGLFFLLLQPLALPNSLWTLNLRR